MGMEAGKHELIVSDYMVLLVDNQRLKFRVYTANIFVLHLDSCFLLNVSLLIKVKYPATELTDEFPPVCSFRTFSLAKC